MQRRGGYSWYSFEEEEEKKKSSSTSENANGVRDDVRRKNPGSFKERAVFGPLVHRRIERQAGHLSSPAV